MTYEIITKNLNDRVYELKNGQDFFEDLVSLHKLDPTDRKVNKMYSLAWEYGHSGGYSEVFYYFNDLVEVFKG
jgi:hypothetical protein